MLCGCVNTGVTTHTGTSWGSYNNAQTLLSMFYKSASCVLKEFENNYSEEIYANICCVALHKSI